MLSLFGGGDTSRPLNAQDRLSLEGQNRTIQSAWRALSGDEVEALRRAAEEVERNLAGDDPGEAVDLAAPASGPARDHDVSPPGDDLPAEPADLPAEGDDLPREGDDLPARGDDVSAHGDDAETEGDESPPTPAPQA